MRKRIFLIASLVLAMPAIALAADDPFTGTWREVGPHVSLLQQMWPKEKIYPDTYTLIIDGETLDWSFNKLHVLKAKCDGKLMQTRTGGLYRVKRIDSQTIEIIKAAARGTGETRIIWQVKGDTLVETQTGMSSTSPTNKNVRYFERVK
jgi:hypothetical protein